MVHVKFHAQCHADLQSYIVYLLQRSNVYDCLTELHMH